VLGVIHFDGSTIWSGVIDPPTRTMRDEEPGKVVHHIVHGSIGQEIKQRDDARGYVLGKHSIYAIQAVRIHTSDTTGKPPAYNNGARAEDPDHGQAGVAA